MPYYTSAHRFYQFNNPASNTLLRQKIVDEMVATGWVITAQTTDDTTLEVVPTPEGNGDLRVRLWLGTEGGSQIINYQAQNVFTGSNPQLRMYAIPDWRYYFHISPYQVIVWTPYNGHWDGRYMAFGVLYTPPDFHVGTPLVDCGAWIANYQAQNILTHGDWQWGPYVMNLEQQPVDTQSLYLDANGPTWWPDSGKSLIDPWLQFKFSNNPLGPGANIATVVGALFDAIFLSGVYPSGEVVTFDERPWINLTQFSPEERSLLLPMWSD